MSGNSYVQNEGDAHQSDPVSERKHDLDRWVQPCHQSLIAFKNFTKSLLLRSKNVRNGPRILASVELYGEGMGVEAFSSQSFVLVCGSIEYCGKVIGRKARCQCLIVGGHRDNKEKLGSAQVANEDRLWEWA